MKASKRVLKETKIFTLCLHESRQSGRKHYSITMRSWYILASKLPEVRKYFDPSGCRGQFASSWKYRTRDQAEKLLTMAILRWEQ